MRAADRRRRDRRADVPADTIIRDALHVAAATDRPIWVVEDDRLVGVVDRAPDPRIDRAGAEDGGDTSRRLGIAARPRSRSRRRRRRRQIGARGCCSPALMRRRDRPVSPVPGPVDAAPRRDSPLFRALNGVRDWRRREPDDLEPVHVSRGHRRRVRSSTSSHGPPRVARLAGRPRRRRRPRATRPAAGGSALWRSRLRAARAPSACGTASMETLSLTSRRSRLPARRRPARDPGGPERPVRALLTPILDVMQIMPTFAYLPR